MNIMNRIVLILGLIVIGSIFLVAEQANAACARADQLCYTVGTAMGLTCVPTNFCEEKECLGKNLGIEITLVPAEPEPDLWLARSEGILVTIDEIGPLNCLLTRNKGVTFIEFPEERHCVVSLVTEEHFYLEFFASIPEIPCFGWAECICE